MANTQDPQSEQQDAVQNDPAAEDNIMEVIMNAAQAVRSGAPDADSKVLGAIAVLSRARATGFANAALAAINGEPDAESKLQGAIAAMSSVHAERLVKVAQAAINGEPDAERELQWVITQFLSRGCDELISQAQEKSGSQALASKIGETTRVVAINAIQRHGPEKADILQCKLMAIPLVLTLPDSEYTEVPRALSQEDIDWLTQSFVAHGLMDPASEQMLLAPQLWRTQDIDDLPYSKVWSLAQAFGKAMTDQTAIDPEAVLGIQVAPQEIAPDKVNTCLRYVIGAFAHPYGSEPSTLAKDDTGAKIEAWQQEAANYLGNQYRCKAGVCAPDSLYKALLDGWFWSHMSSLASQFSEVLGHYRVLPGEMTAVISLHFIEEDVYQLHIGYSRYTEAGKPELLGGSIWPLAPFEEPTETAENIRQALESNGVAAVEISGEIQNGFNSTDGAPFLLPTQQAAPDPSGHMPAPTHLQ